MSSNKALVSGLEGRYASALFDLAKDKGALDGAENDLLRLEALLEESKDFNQLVTSPVIGKDAQVAGVAATAKTLEMNELVANLLGVLAQNRRLSKLGSVIGAYKKLAAAERGEVTADVTSAAPLSDKQVESLKASLKAAVGQDVIFETRVDESLLGGLVVKIGSRMVDNSLKSKLENLKVSMKGV